MDTNGVLQMQGGRSLIVVAIFCMVSVVMEGQGRAHAEEGREGGLLSQWQPEGVLSPEESGLQAACWVLTIPYGAAKMAYAIGGGIVGGLSWAITGGDTEVAKSVWYPSMTGDYIVQPQQLTGDKPIRFVGLWTDQARF